MRYYHLTGCGLMFNLALLSCKPAPTGTGLPNIVLIMADDMGYECLGSNGSTEYSTPNLDRLASTGIRFTHCYSQSLCTPSRVKLMTGKYNFRNYEDFGYLNPAERTFGNMLKEAGYATCIAGKWQLNGLNRNNPGSEDVTRPYGFGFDEYCLWQLNFDTGEGERYANPLVVRNGHVMPRDPDSYGPDVVSDFILDYIDRKAGNPFFVYYPMILPHSPFVPTPHSGQWAEPDLRYRQDTAFFADMVAYLDHIVGKIESKLREKGVWDNTVFIFTADNGTHQAVRSSTTQGVVRGAKGATINTGNHVPLIITWPDKIKKARIYDGLVDFSDFLPTLADMAGISPETYFTDGLSFLDILHGKNSRSGKEEIFIHYTPRWGWPTANNQHNRWVMDRQYKLYRDGRFFNTLNDPLENNELENLNKTEKKIKEKFTKIIENKEVEYPFHLNDQKIYAE